MENRGSCASSRFLQRRTDRMSFFVSADMTCLRRDKMPKPYGAAAPEPWHARKPPLKPWPGPQAHWYGVTGPRALRDWDHVQTPWSEPGAPRSVAVAAGAGMHGKRGFRRARHAAGRYARGCRAGDRQRHLSGTAVAAGLPDLRPCRLRRAAAPAL